MGVVVVMEVMMVAMVDKNGHGGCNGGDGGSRDDAGVVDYVMLVIFWRRSASQSQTLIICQIYRFRSFSPRIPWRRRKCSD